MCETYTALRLLGTVGTEPCMLPPCLLASHACDTAPALCFLFRPSRPSQRWVWSSMATALKLARCAAQIPSPPTTHDMKVRKKTRCTSTLRLSVAPPRPLLPLLPLLLPLVRGLRTDESSTSRCSGQLGPGKISRSTALRDGTRSLRRSGAPVSQIQASSAPATARAPDVFPPLLG